MQPSGYDNDGRRPRLPLRESTGNIQHHGLGGASLCPQDFSGLPSGSSSITKPPVLQHHTLDSTSSSHHAASLGDYRRTRHATRSYQHALDSGLLYAQGLSSLAPPPSIPTPPVVPTQSLDAHYGAAGSLRLRRQNLQMQRRRRHGINPFYHHPLFQSYRKKQADKDAKVWPEVLEDAFLDGEYSYSVSYWPDG